MKSIVQERYEILVIGAGGAGLRAAIEAKSLGKEVLVVGKRSKFDAHTALAAGGINAVFGNLDPNDSKEQHFADTYLEGYGIGDPDIIEIMVNESPKRVKEIDEWGANFKRLKNGKLDQRFFGAHTYRRTCYSGDYTGKSILNALLNKADSMAIPIIDTTYITELIIYEDRCIGAMSFDIKSGEKKIILSKAIIICTGGHTGIWKRNSSRKDENNGDGLALAINAGCELIDMEMVQFHPTGMIFPEEISGNLVTEAVRGEGGKLYNNKGQRFMESYDKERLELSTRDKVAIANYTEIKDGRGTPRGGVYLDISHIEKDKILEKLPNIFKQFKDYQNIDISKEPMEVAPTAHYSMGGIKVCAIKHSTSISGLFAAGEVAGGLHGANRLGGNSLAEILVFGKKAGKSASEYSSTVNFTNEIPTNIINKIDHNINQLMFKEMKNPKLFLNNLKDIMWQYCGVIKNKKGLEFGLNKIDEMGEKFKKSSIKKTKNKPDFLVDLFNIKFSILVSKLTLISTIHREESRGAHQRSDFKDLNKSRNYNIICKITNRKISIEKKPTKILKKDIVKFIKNDLRNKNIGIKLLE
ncbi:Succinate dehydrogenase [Prochlorococcus marinus str. MIT 9312]|uniref:Succinate dehydrogenase n=1 Tax=Prochlorococcus marinus (strain MIT 9312) TaxID=74546 RepID=Q319N1_PROM9|nr:FAD-binding protein [Prochlorococcus marinus]ABB50414.1 Succinate dehydrogenase [Prochlorococcus marinus str. MIT 9312]KGF99787.1 Succinate dehydrogenase flavoprotein subunit [Prochlorococcus marinus str. MIT 9311]